jgi:hypothetical protein
MGETVHYLVSITRVSMPGVMTDGHSDESADVTALFNDQPKAWLFQSNPLLYDLGAALRSLKEQVWSVSRYAKRITVGDRVYLWEAGLRGGVAALAEIVEPVHLQSEPAEQFRFARVPEVFAGERQRTRLRVSKVIEPVVAREAVASCPDLAALGVLRCSRGTNFRVSTTEQRALDKLIQSKMRR